MDGRGRESLFRVAFKNRSTFGVAEYYRYCMRLYAFVKTVLDITIYVEEMEKSIHMILGNLSLFKSTRESSFSVSRLIKINETY